MQQLRSIIRKKINSLGLAKKFDESDIKRLTNLFIVDHIKGVDAKADSYYNGVLTIKAKSGAEANELYFFEEELKFFLEKSGYRTRKIRITY